ncbi:MAG: hypothetical protein ACLQRM_08865 [Acidimicrobiales bacterium]|jgi:hypothetical protein
MTRSGVDKLVKRDARFPAPLTVLARRTRVWDRDAVENWGHETGRTEIWDSEDDRQLRHFIRHKRLGGT